jgi:hypothetical protein
MMPKRLLVACQLVIVASATSQPDTSMNMDATYERPFRQIRETPVSLGGYLEADYQYIGTDGVTEGHTFRIPRMTLFVSANLHQRVKFLSEIELEEGGHAIAIEFAALDIKFHRLLNLRGGVVMNPIGAFNQNHDGPKWDFVDRPIAMTEMLPATWSNVGFGLFGKWHYEDWTVGYEAYLTNGFNDSIISNDQNKTFLPASKTNHERFEESSNGRPLVTSRLSCRNNNVGEVGLSWMGGAYNTIMEDGLQVDLPRHVDVLDFDVKLAVPRLQTTVTAEWAWVFVDVPETYSQQFGSRQQGGFVDIVQPLLKKKLFWFKDAVWHLALRLEYVDWNVGTFSETGGDIADDLWAIVPGVSFRPIRETVLRFNYRRMYQRDLFGNPPSQTAGIQLGIASYF